MDFLKSVIAEPCVMLNSDRAESVEVLIEWVKDARAKSLELIADLDDDQLFCRPLPTINPLLWEIGHAAFFQEHWVLQHGAHHKPIRSDGCNLFDSISIAHDTRWDLPVPCRDELLKYVRQVRDDVLDLLECGNLDERLLYFVKLSVFHEDMHTEAFTYTRQTMGYPAPKLTTSAQAEVPLPSEERRGEGDIELNGGAFRLGAITSAPFVFDNEKWAHAVEVQPFAISCTAVTQGQFCEFVDDGGYKRDDYWCDDGLKWRRENNATQPLYWKSDGAAGWLRRDFDTWKPLEEDHAMIHVNWFEANAFCRWAGRRLPTEAEWELAASLDKRAEEKRHYPWGDEEPSHAHANLDWCRMGTAEVAAHAAGDSAAGCRQMLGNVWEWTADTFQPYPGFVVDPYKDYSRTSFGNCKVLRGGCWVTRSRLLRNTWRNYYGPDRRDVWAGFRTCAVERPDLRQPRKT